MIECKKQTDEELVQSVLLKRDFFGCLIDRYEAKIRRYIRRIMPGVGDDEDDLMQDIFIKAYVNIQSFDTGLKFSSWIYRIAHNEAVSWVRKKNVRPETVELGKDDFETFTKSIEVFSNSSEQKLNNDEVNRILSLLSEKYRMVLVLKFLEGKNYKEISDILTIPMGSVATLVHRAKKQFIRIYSKQHE